jgi:uncharacterized membrane protein YkoI
VNAALMTGSSARPSVRAMHRLKKLLIGLVAVAALGLGGAALAGAASGGTDDEGARGLGADLKARLAEAALAETGGGTVGAMERDSEKGATYEVEVKRTDGSQVDVRLDDQLGLVAIDGDGEH